MTILGWYITFALFAVCITMAHCHGYLLGARDGRKDAEKTATLRHQKERRTTAWFNRMHSRS